MSSSVDDAPETVPRTDHYVLDEDYLIHRLKWTEGSTHSSLADNYASFTFAHYGKATVVFDEYTGGPSTKDNTHQRRKSRAANKVDISDAGNLLARKKPSSQMI